MPKTTSPSTNHKSTSSRSPRATTAVPTPPHRPRAMAMGERALPVSLRQPYDFSHTDSNSQCFQLKDLQILVREMLGISTQAP
eukprot:scaffold239314_cov32-Tisochrysis_lutea.AAC.1